MRHVVMVDRRAVENALVREVGHAVLPRHVDKAMELICCRIDDAADPDNYDELMLRVCEELDEDYE